MLLALVLPCFALTVPLRATLVETVEVGERPVAASQALAARVRVMNPDTETFFTVKGRDLVADQRTASGRGGIVFGGDPAGSLRTWAVYYLDANGKPLGDPEIVDVLFDANGNGGIAARSRGAARMASLSVTNNGTAIDVYDSLGIAVQDAGTEASFVGVVELRSDGASLLDAPDLDVMTAEVFASYQALGLEAIVALDTFGLRVDGSVDVSGLAVSADGVVEGGTELSWLVGYALPNGKTTTWAYLAYEQAIDKVKRKSGEAPRVALRPDDVLVETWDAGTTLSLPGDLRELEVIATLDGVDGDVTLPGGDAVVIDPSSVAVRASLTAAPDAGPSGTTDELLIVEGANGPVESVAEYTVVVTDGRGATIATHDCYVVPAPVTTEGEAVYVGTCTRGESTEVRSLAVVVDAKEVEITVELAGAAFARDYDGGTCTSRVCGDAADTSIVDGGQVVIRDSAGLTVAKSGMSVEETSFHLPFAFGEDPTGLAAEMEVELSDPTRDGLVWTEKEGVLTAQEGGKVVHSITAEDVSVEGAGDVAFKGKEELTPSVAEKGTAASLSLRVNRMTVRRATTVAAPAATISAWATHLKTCCCEYTSIM